MELKELKTWEERFNEKFGCIQSDCDGTGCIPVARSVSRQVSDTEFVEDVEWEAEQCEFHAKYLIPMKEFIAAIRLEAAKEAEKKFNEIAEILQEGDIEAGLTLADTYAGNI